MLANQGIGERLRIGTSPLRGRYSTVINYIAASGGDTSCVLH